MGYILPITHHTYKNYQARMSKGDERPFYVGQTQPVFLNKLDEKVKENKRYYALLERDLSKEVERKQKHPVKNNSVLTGKGKYINERV